MVVRVSSSGFNHLMHNCDFAIDSAHNKIVGAISGDWAKVYPSFIETFVGVAYMDYDSFLKGKGSWMRLPDINSDVSGFYRNHNPRSPPRLIRLFERLPHAICLLHDCDHWDSLRMVLSNLSG